MSISQQELEALIHLAEADLQNNQQVYKRKLLFYSLLGYAVIFALIASLIGLAVGSVILAFYSSFFLILLLKKKLIIPLVIMLWVLFKSIWIKWPKPEGYKVTKKECPQLFVELDTISKQLQTPKIHQVILASDFNAAIAQTPRFGALGIYHNTLFLGIELLLSLSVEEAKAVIAHELGHLSGNHSKFNGWIYRVRESWERIMYSLDQQGGWATAPIRAFFDWYAPRFSAYSFALARLNEYEADKIAAETTTAKDASSALINVYATAPFIEEKYWETFFKQADDHPKPNRSPFIGLYEFVQENKQDRKEILQRIKEAMKEKTGYANTHPALKDRLEALGDFVLLPEPVKFSAAHALLGDHLKVLINDFDKLWIDYHSEQWREHYDKTQTEKAKLKELEEKTEQELNQQDAWELAYLTDRFISSEKAMPLFESYNKGYPDDLKGHYVLGQLKLDQGDDSGLVLLKQACQQDELVRGACEFAYKFLIKKSREEEAQEWLKRVTEQDKIDELAQRERSQITEQDTIIPLAIDKELAAYIGNQITGHDKVKNVWLAQKEVTYYLNSPVLVFAIETSGFFTDEDEVLSDILDALETPITVFGVAKKQHGKMFELISSAGVPVN